MITAIIIRLVPYKERDYIVTALTSDGFLTFKAVGAQKPTSSSGASLSLYSLVNVELKETKAGHTLTFIKPITNTVKLLSDYNRLASFSLVGEISSKLLKNEREVQENFPLLEAVLIKLDNSKHLYSLLYLFIVLLLKNLGYGFIINKCVNCGKTTNIIGVDFELGGLVCKHCQNNVTTIYSPHEIKMIRYGFMIDETQLTKFEFTDEEIKPLLLRFIQFIENTYNLKLISKNIMFE